MTTMDRAMFCAVLAGMTLYGCSAKKERAGGPTGRAEVVQAEAGLDQHRSVAGKAPEPLAPTDQGTMAKRSRPSANAPIGLEAPRELPKEVPAEAEPAQTEVPSVWMPTEEDYARGYSTAGGHRREMREDELPNSERLRQQAQAAPESYAGEELWVISRATVLPGQGPIPSEDRPSEPVLRGKMPDNGEEIPLPLEHTDVKASIAAYIASVHVKQRYHNPYAAKIEAVYVFPLPQDAAVNEFVMTIGKRHIRGIIRERQEAERVYAEAKRQGYVASLMTQERPNVFTQSVANIEPGKVIDIAITYFNMLSYHNGEYEFVFPMVVGPRFNPPASRSGIGAVARGQHGISGQATEVQYLKPGERSGHDIALAVDIDAGLSIESVASPSHAIETTALSDSRQQVKLSRLDTLPNKDFVLRYKVAGEAIKSGMLVHRDKRGGFFTLMLQPPAEMAALPRAPMEMVFVLDCSGSMDGYPIEKAKAALKRALRRLGAADTFQIVRFSDSASQFGARPIAATAANVERAIVYVDGLRGEGGTMMIEGIKAALDFPHDRRRMRIVSFMTDGYIGNEAEILGAIHQRLGEARIFSFGVGSSVNRHLLDSMARMGRGAVAYVGLDESSERAVDMFYESVAHPALTGIEVNWGDLNVTDVYPKRIPDLFVGRPVILTGRFQGKGPTTIHLSGRSADREHDISLPVQPDGSDSSHAAIASVWARMKIADLEARSTYDDAGKPGSQIKSVALEYGLMSAYTAFVAVDSSAVTAGDHGTTVSQALLMPEGVSYENTVQEER